MTLKIAIVGPESSGKSTLASQLAKRFNAPLVPEFARPYLEKTGGTYVEKDLKDIADGQIQLENEALRLNSEMIICDTNLLVIKIWGLYKYNRCDEQILDQMEKRSYDLQLLLRPDLPWEADVLRENPHDRDRLFAMYYDDLVTAGKPFEVIGGKDRLNQAIESTKPLGIE